MCLLWKRAKGDIQIVFYGIFLQIRKYVEIDSYK